MGEKPAPYATRMGEVIAGGKAEMRARPPFSVLICTIAPLGQDGEGIEAGMVYAEAGIPVGFMGMPNMGATAPATAGGAPVTASWAKKIGADAYAEDAIGAVGVAKKLVGV